MDIHPGSSVDLILHLDPLKEEARSFRKAAVYDAEGNQYIISKSTPPITKILGLWALSVLFMFILHSIVFFISSLSMKTPILEYLIAFLICSLNLLFVVLAVLLLSLMLPDVAAFLSAVKIVIVSLALNGIYSFSQSQMGQAMMQQSMDHGPLGFTWWNAVYYLWPNIFGTQYFATSLLGNEGGVAAYPLINVLLYTIVLGVLLFWHFRNEDIV